MNYKKPELSDPSGKPSVPPTGEPSDADRDSIDPEDKVEEASFESFPASDPPSFTPSRAGKPAESPKPDREH